ncbi:MAG: hypothetical protein ACI3VB_07740 [Oscillospiraceae bacterium]
MTKDLKGAAEKFLSTEEGRKLAGRKGDIEELASSKDGEAVKSMLQKGGFEEALQKGDTDAIKNALSGVVKTDAGARLMKQLQQMLDGK